MNALLLGLMLAQAAPVQIVVRIVRPRCVVIGDNGEAREVLRREMNALQPDVQVAGCTRSGGAGAPRVEQRVEVAGTATEPEQRLVEVIY